MALGLFWATVSLVVFMTITTADMAGFFRKKNQFDVNGKVCQGRVFHPKYQILTECRQW
jgi:hypothetical protein